MVKLTRDAAVSNNCGAGHGVGHLNPPGALSYPHLYRANRIGAEYQLLMDETYDSKTDVHVPGTDAHSESGSGWGYA